VSRSTWAKVAVIGTVAALTALGGQAVASAEQRAILGADSKNAIEGSYIVVLKDGVSTSAASASQASKYDAKITKKFTSALHGYAAKMSESDAKQLAADSSVAYVEQDQKVSLSTDQLNPPSWGLDRVDQRDLPLNSKYSYATTAANVNAYVIDTGILTTHGDFEGRARWGANTSGDGNNSDCNGHGTHVAGTIGGQNHGLAKDVKLTAVKVLNCQGSGSNSGVIAGIDWVTSNAVKPAVANMSLGGGASTALDDAVKRSINAGITYAIASGNGDFLGNPQNACNYSPARTGGTNGPAITVNASTRTDAKGSFSNYGSCTDLYAPGVDITSAWIGSNTATRTISGTSMATPHVAGAAALYLATNTAATPAQVKSHINSTATTGKIGAVPSGTPNRLLFTGSGGTEPPPPPPPTGCSGTNGTNVNIPDAGAAVTSSITISNCNRNASSSSTIAVDIKHSWRGDLVIDLVAPDGTAYRLKSSSSSDSADNVITTYTRSLSTEAANGTWRLRVQDVYSWDTGYIDSWTLTV
jgi:subtilisin family serine protease